MLGRCLSALVLFAATSAPATEPEAILSFRHEGEAVFEVWFEDLSRFEATRARIGAPKMALYLTQDYAEVYERFIARHAGRFVDVYTCGEYLGRRLIEGGDLPGRIQVIFMDTDRSRAYLAALDAGGC